MATDNTKQGSVEILGIYGNSAYAAEPKDVYTCDVNQVPMMYFDYLPEISGNVVFGIKIDGAPLKDHSAEQTYVSVVTAANEVKRRARDFWIPQKYRVPGDHKVTIWAGHSETYTVFGFYTRNRTVVDTSKTFTMTFTGTKKNGD